MFSYVSVRCACFERDFARIIDNGRGRSFSDTVGQAVDCELSTIGSSPIISAGGELFLSSQCDTHIRYANFPGFPIQIIEAEDAEWNGSTQSLLRYKTGDFPDPYPLPSPEELWAKMDLYGTLEALAVQEFHEFAGRIR